MQEERAKGLAAEKWEEGTRVQPSNLGRPLAEPPRLPPASALYQSIPALPPIPTPHCVRSGAGLSVRTGHPVLQCVCKACSSMCFRRTSRTGGSQGSMCNPPAISFAQEFRSKARGHSPTWTEPSSLPASLTSLPPSPLFLVHHSRIMHAGTPCPGLQGRRNRPYLAITPQTTRRCAPASARAHHPAGEMCKIR